MINFNNYFQTLTGFTPRQFQIETIQNILNYHNTILRAPTGSGKTETAIAPFLFAKSFNYDFPNKLIYVVPLRTLANSLRQRVQKYIDKWQAIYPLSRRLVVTLQTGENPEDPCFEGDIIFCTIDQMLSSFLNIPFSVGRGSANVNAGVFFTSYLVFDELHLLDADRAFTTVLKVLQQINGLTPFLLMTATLTDELVQQVSTEINDSQLNFIKVNDSDLLEIEGDRQRYFDVISTPLSAEVILNDIQQNQRKRVIVICNTVSQSQGLFRDLDELNEAGDLDITLLHSRFLPEDRAKKEKYLTEKFSQDSLDDGICYVLISTQVIEVGLNITCEVMHTHLCPMNSLLQRVGRCARFRGEKGEVYIYQSIEFSAVNLELAEQDLEDEPDKLILGRGLEIKPNLETTSNLENKPNSPTKRKRLYPPYENDVCELTWNVLQTHNPTEKITFNHETNWINQVHCSEDIKNFERRKNNRGEFEQNWDKAVFAGEQSQASKLIRLVDNRTVFIWEDQAIIIDGDADDDQVDVSKLPVFSIPKTTLCKVYQDVKGEGYRRGWIFGKICYRKSEDKEGYTQESNIPISSYSELVSSPRLLLNQNYAYYDNQIGLVMGLDVERFNLDSHKSQFSLYQKQKKQKLSEYRYHMDTYIGHLGMMWTCWNKSFISNDGKNLISVKDELLSFGGKFIQVKIFPHVSRQDAAVLFECLVFLAILTHDLGKLQIKWQDCMRGWQTIAYNTYHGKDPKSYLLAHTDYNPDDREQKKALKDHEKRNKRPNHAVEGAFIAQEILAESLGVLLEDFQATEEQFTNLIQIILMAIGRHHTAWAMGWKSVDLAKIGIVKLHPDAIKIIEQSWNRLLPSHLPLQPATITQLSYPLEEVFSLDDITSDDEEFYQLYLLVVRALRLCDRRAVQLQ
ncbi:CRISPR-associated helicase Cas3' [Aphanothece hegewaldii CCALA 016]|uniref:CRISPR-associated helicase Cas3 n=1 Tax=Aphanothece hegewaldii CCALA 016 TaxID=2107694 RepID=A0A2T1LYC0_9CHRO|nr:CRISPR-associated helicase Cas3' [Aphanothece hegewaldii]PSF37391.1 CRISPR-associated helicase Cas3' [Aphanothece hegewaldii CCALA 016]